MATGFLKKLFTPDETYAEQRGQAKPAPQTYHGDPFAESAAPAPSTEEGVTTGVQTPAGPVRKDAAPENAADQVKENAAVVLRNLHADYGVMVAWNGGDLFLDEAFEQLLKEGKPEAFEGLVFRPVCTKAADSKEYVYIEAIDAKPVDPALGAALVAYAEAQAQRMARILRGQPADAPAKTDEPKPAEPKDSAKPGQSEDEPKAQPAAEPKPDQSKPASAEPDQSKAPDKSGQPAGSKTDKSKGKTDRPDKPKPVDKAKTDEPKPADAPAKPVEPKTRGAYGGRRRVTL